MNFSELSKKFKSGEIEDFFSKILITDDFGPHITCCVKKGNNILKVKNANHNNSVINLSNIDITVPSPIEIPSFFNIGIRENSPTFPGKNKPKDQLKML